MHEIIMKKLYEKFNLSTRQGQGGMTFKYVPNEDVINRMNEVFVGDWSTAVKFRDVLDDQVILEVEVSVVDPDTQMTHSHTGFGSQQIMRYNSGSNKGKIIDIGNGYKGALAKAIVNACTRWGVGLFKETTPMAVSVGAAPAIEVPMMPTQLPPVSVPTPMPPVKPPAIASTPMPILPTTTATATVPMPILPTATVAPVAVIAPSIVANPIMPSIPVVPVAPQQSTTATPPPSPYKIESTAPVVEVPVVPMPPMVEAPIVETITTFPPPLAPNQPVAAHINLTQEVAPPTMPKMPPPAIDSVPATPELPLSRSGALSEIGISDVQRVALNGILTMNSAQYGELAQEAFQANGIDKPVPNKEDLNYDQAVVVIKFGNDKFRKNR